MVQRKKKELKKEIVYQVYHGLKKKYKVFKQKKPLKINIHKDVIRENREIPSEYLQEAIKWMVQSNDYLEKIAEGGKRFDLRGRPVARIRPGEVKYAQELLEKRAAARGWRQQREALEAELEAVVERGVLRRFGVDYGTFFEEEQRRFKMKAWAELSDERRVSTSPAEYDRHDEGRVQAMLDLKSLLEVLGVDLEAEADHP